MQVIAKRIDRIADQLNFQAELDYVRQPVDRLSRVNRSAHRKDAPPLTR
jgi:hypothetical protein